MWWKSLLAASTAFLFGSLAALHAAGPPLGADPTVPVPIQAHAVPMNVADPAADRIGRLRYLGGIELTSTDQRFGGLSALVWEPACGRLLGLTDTGVWVALDPDEQDGRLTGVRTAWLAPILGADGKPPRTKNDADAESLTRMPDGDLWVFYEQVHRGERFRGVSGCRPASLAAVPVERWVPDAVADWPSNGGIEASAERGGRLLLLSEALATATGGRAGLDARAGTVSVPFAYRAPMDFQPTAMEPLDEHGRMLVLHRRFSPLTGAAALLAEADMPGQIPSEVTPREIARLAPPFTVDNMEALAVRREGERIYLYLASDNNFNSLQRTILLKFELLPAGHQ